MNEHIKQSSPTQAASPSSRRSSVSDGPGAAPEAASSASGGGVANPLTLTGGLPVQIESRAQSVDWITMVGAAADYDRVRAVLVAEFGECASAAPPRQFYSDAEQWPNGVRIQSGHDEPKAFWLVDLPGRVLSAMAPSDGLVLLARLVDAGGRATRLDVAIDAFGEPGQVDLVGAVVQSAERGELSGARRVDPRCVRSGGQVVEYGVNLGKRGKDGSGRYIRVYDKGLETGEYAVCTWHRWEVEFRSDAAADVAARLAAWVAVRDSDRLPYVGDDAMHELQAVALGAVDFRERTGASRAFARRPRVGWWSRFVESVRLVRIKIKPRHVTFQGYVAYLKQQVAPRLNRLADLVGTSAGQVFDRYAGGASRMGRVDAVVWEAAQYLGLDPAIEFTEGGCRAGPS